MTNLLTFAFFPPHTFKKTTNSSLCLIEVRGGAFVKMEKVLSSNNKEHQNSSAADMETLHMQHSSSKR